MAIEADAWCLYPGDEDDPGPAELVRERITLPAPGPGEVLVEPIYGSYEGNYQHALTRTPVDICRQRGEPRVVLGNAGVVRILALGEGVSGLSPGQPAMMWGAARRDRYGYMTHAFAYDAPGTSGCMATRMVMLAENLMPLPAGTRHSLAQWAAFSVRYVTAWANWRVAYGTFRLLVDAEMLPDPHVWGWGGGTTFAELDLARRHGARAVMISGDPGRQATIEAAGITALDRRPFAALTAEPAGFPSAAAHRAAAKAAERVFLAEVAARTGGEGVHIFVEYLGTPVVLATLKALARPAVITTAGWKHGMATTNRRAIECIRHHQHIHTHYGTRADCVAAMAYGEAHGWMPEPDPPAPFDAIPALARRFAEGRCGFFPLFAVNPE